MNQALGWKSDEGAKATLVGVELWSMIKNGQLDNPEGFINEQLNEAIKPLRLL